MDRNVTRREVLLECLEIIRLEWKMTSKSYNCLEPKEGMEAAFDDCLKKCVVLQQLIQALENEPVRAAIAKFLDEEPERGIAQWQKDLMEGREPQIWSGDLRRKGSGSGKPA